MKKIALITIIFMITLVANAQLVNLNPDPNGVPWYVGSIPDITPEVQLLMDQIPEMTQVSFRARSSIVDNSEHQYMRSVFDQDGESCSQASGIGYVFTYEINWERDLSANDINPENLYPPGFTYNYLNSGDYNVGSSILEGWQIVQEMGCPNIATYGDMYINSSHWPSGYDIYNHAMQNRISTPYKLTFSTYPNQAMETLKQWIYDHNDPNTDPIIGGIATFQTYIQELSYGLYDFTDPLLLEYDGEPLVKNWDSGQDGKHQLTIVGYNDDVYYDLDGSGGPPSNDEYGAFKVYNSWGVTYPPVGTPHGYVYFPYKIFLENVSIVHVLKVEEEYSPELSLRVKMTHPDRSELKFYTQVGANSSSTPDIWYATGGLCESYFALENKGGDFPMQGDSNNNPIELELDLSYFYANQTFGKIFLNIKNDYDYDDGELQYLSLIDRRWNEEFELVTDYEDNDFDPNSDNVFDIDYDLLNTPDDTFYPFLATQTIETNKVCRFDASLGINSTLTVNSGVKIDFYNSVLTIPEGSTLHIKAGAIMAGKKGISRIDVYGSIILEKIFTGPFFMAEEGSELILNFPNNNVSYTVNDSEFNGAELRSTCNNLTVTNCVFKNYAHIEVNKGGLGVDNCDFEDSYINVFPEQQQENLIEISDCDFDNQSLTMTSICIDNYLNYNIHDNIISYYYGNGIAIYNSGGTQGIHQFDITNNVISCNYSKKSSVSNTGIKIYQSEANILEDNYIYNNDVGISILNYSTAKITGSASIPCSSLPQKIINNYDHQIYLSRATVPIDFHYNQIYEVAEDSYFIYELTGAQIPTQWVATQNFWNEVANPTAFIYTTLLPICNPVCGPHKTSAAETNFDSAVNFIIAGDYQLAENLFKEIIIDTGVSNYKYASINQLFELKNGYDQDYAGLKLYLDTTLILQDTNDLGKMADNVSNRCDIKLENYQTAISFFENIIQNSGSCQDSTFAIIDLGNLYLTMNTKRANTQFICQFPQFIPESRQKYVKERERLISLLTADKSPTSNDEGLDNDIISIIENITVFPNPTNGEVTIDFNIESSLKLYITVCDQTGRVLFETKAYDYFKGNSNVKLNLAVLKNGVYYLLIKNNSRSIASKKLILMK